MSQEAGRSLHFSHRCMDALVGLIKHGVVRLEGAIEQPDGWEPDMSVCPSRDLVLRRGN